MVVGLLVIHGSLPGAGRGGCDTVFWEEREGGPHSSIVHFLVRLMMKKVNFLITL